MCNPLGDVDSRAPSQVINDAILQYSRLASGRPHRMVHMPRHHCAANRTAGAGAFVNGADSASPDVHSNSIRLGPELTGTGTSAGDSAKFCRFPLNCTMKDTEHK